MTSALGLYAGMDPPWLDVLSPWSDGFLRVTSAATLVDLMAASMATDSLARIFILWRQTSAPEIMLNKYIIRVWFGSALPYIHNNTHL